jgi:lipopolysaccharide exporter
MVAMSFDNFLVGTFVSLAALGFYDRAYRLAEWPNKLVTSVVTRTAFYTYANLQNDVVRLQKTVTMLSWLLAVITIPIALVIFATAPDLIALLYGERWLPSAIFLRLLVVYSLIRPMLDNAGSLLVATGHPRRGTLISIIHASSLILIATPLTLAYGTIGTCVGVGIAFIIALGLAAWQVRRTLPLRLFEIWFAPVSAATCAGLAFAIFANGLVMGNLPLVVRVIVEAGFVGLVFFAALFIIQPRQFIERSRYVWQLLRASPIDVARKLDG